MAVVIFLNNPGGPEGDTVTMDGQLLNTQYLQKQNLGTSLKATNARFDETMGDIPVISCEGPEVLQRTRVRQVF